MFKFSFLFILFFLSSTCKSDTLFLSEKNTLCNINNFFSDDYDCRMKEMDFLGNFSKILDQSDYDERIGFFVRAIFIFDLKKNSTTGFRLKLTRLKISDSRKSFNDIQQIEEQFYSKMEELSDELWKIINHKIHAEDCTQFIYVETFRLCG